MMKAATYRRVLIIDDVITTWTALREAVGMPKRESPASSATEERVRDTEPKSVVGVVQGDFGESILIRKDHHWLKRLDRRAQ